MKPMFISFSGHRAGIFSMGWAVVNCSAILDGADVEKLTCEVEKLRGYDKDSLVITNFRRLEEA